MNLSLRRLNRETAAIMLAGLLLLLGVYAYFGAQLYRGYLLVRDDPANIGGTVQGGPLGWLTRGMAGYYRVYPEWPQPGFSNFYRPVWNLIIYLERAVLGAHYWAWFLAFCILQYLGALLFLRVLRFLDVPPRPAALFAILFLFNPAFVNSGFLYPGFQFDVLVSVVLLAAVYCLLRRRFGLALALVTAAVFTKETAIFAPVAAAITVLVLKRDVKWSLAMLAPIVAWVAARWLAYHAVLGGTFASPANLHDLFANIGRGLIVWPSGAVPPSASLRLAGAQGVVLVALLLVNAALWLVLGWSGWQVARGLLRTPWTLETKRRLILLVWALGALAFCLLIRPQIRFGAGFYALLLLFLAYFLHTCDWRRPLKLVPIAIVSFVTVIDGGDFVRHAVANGAADRSGEKALYAGLRSLPQDGRPVFVVNAPSMLSAPVFIATSWGLQLHITFINQFSGCRRGDGRYDLSPTALSVDLPSCASYVLASVPDEVQAKALRGDLLRPGVGVYRFSAPPMAGKRLGSGDIDFGRTLAVRFEHPPGTVLAYDWRTGAYRVLATEP